ncbi:MAG: PqqD family protein [Anaerolineae bacterium]|nr:PqqD family protein [Anaerolineae bacterium]
MENAPPPLDLEKHPRQIEGVREYTLLDEMVLYVAGRETVYSFNSSARMVWQRCDGLHSIRSIGQDIARTIGCEAEDLLPDILALLADLQRLELITL